MKSKVFILSCWLSVLTQGAASASTLCEREPWKCNWGSCNGQRWKPTNRILNVDLWYVKASNKAIDFNANLVNQRRAIRNNAENIYKCYETTKTGYLYCKTNDKGYGSFYFSSKSIDSDSPTPNVMIWSDSKKIIESKEAILIKPLKTKKIKQDQGLICYEDGDASFRSLSLFSLTNDRNNGFLIELKMHFVEKN